jgi:hypothetical protein
MTATDDYARQAGSLEVRLARAEREIARLQRENKRLRRIEERAQEWRDADGRGRTEDRLLDALEEP